MRDKVRLLLLAHAGAVPATVAAVRERHPTAELDILLFGRAAEDTPVPPDVHQVRLPAGMPRTARGVGDAIGFVTGLWRRRYARAVIGLPDLRVNQSRGAILGAALLAGARDAVAIDPATRASTRPIGRAGLLADAVRFVTFHAAGHAVSAVAGRILDRAARAPRPPAPEPAADGRVVYLRTDVELAMAPLLAGGSLAHTIGIIRSLRHRGHDVDLLTTGEIAGAADLAAERRIPVVLQGNVPREVCELLSGLLQGLAPLPEGPPPAFVYQRHSMNNLAGVLLARRWGVPFVLEANASEVQWREEWSSLRLPRLGRACERAILARTDRIAAVSANAAGHLTRAGAPADRLRVVPNGVDVERFATAAPGEVPFPADSFTIAFTGLFYPWHGVRYLAEAFPSVLRSCPSARLLLVGDGEDAPRVRQILEDAGVIEQVHMPGLVPSGDVPGYLAAADVLVSPHAADETFIGSPIKIWEYMASGRAIVSSGVAQLGKVIEHERTGLLVPPRDPEALAAAIVRLHGDPELRGRLGAAARAEAADRHSWEVRLDATLVS